MSVAHPLVVALESRRLFAALPLVIDSEASTFTIDARVDVDHVGDFKLGSQADGTRTAHLAGTLNVDATSKGLRLNGGSAIRAIEHDGEFDPGDAPAAFAVDGKVKKLGITLAKVNAAFRDLTFDISGSSRKQVVKADKRFDLRNAKLEVTRGHVDYALDSKFGDGDGDETLDGLRAGIANTRAKFSGGVGTRAMSIYIRSSFEYDLDDNATLTFSLSGTILARENGTASPTTGGGREVISGGYLGSVGSSGSVLTTGPFSSGLIYDNVSVGSLLGQSGSNASIATGGLSPALLTDSELALLLGSPVPIV